MSICRALPRAIGTEACIHLVLGKQFFDGMFEIFLQWLDNDLPTAASIASKSQIIERLRVLPKSYVSCL